MTVTLCSTVISCISIVPLGYGLVIFTLHFCSHYRYYLVRLLSHPRPPLRRKKGGGGGGGGEKPYWDSLLAFSDIGRPKSYN